MVLLRGRRGFVSVLWCVTSESFDRVRRGLCKKTTRDRAVRSMRKELGMWCCGVDLGGAS